MSVVGVTLQLASVRVYLGGVPLYVTFPARTPGMERTVHSSVTVSMRPAVTPLLDSVPACRDTQGTGITCLVHCTE